MKNSSNGSSLVKEQREPNIPPDMERGFPHHHPEQGIPIYEWPPPDYQWPPTDDSGPRGQPGRDDHQHEEARKKPSREQGPVDMFQSDPPDSYRPEPPGQDRSRCGRRSLSPRRDRQPLDEGVGLPDRLLPQPTHHGGAALDETESLRITVGNELFCEHTGDRPYVCSHCDKAFIDNSNFKKHVRTHTGERPFMCMHCKNAFTDSNNLKRHMRTHTGEKPYVCSYCDYKAFSRNEHLKRHLRTHTGERPYVCSYCDKAFVRNDHLKIHIRTHTCR